MNNINAVGFISVGAPLHKLQVDSYTISEIVRLHLLGSGCERASVSARFDYQQRGGYSSVDDPALDFRRYESSILKALEDKHLFELSSGVLYIVCFDS